MWSCRELWGVSSHRAGTGPGASVGRVWTFSWTRSMVATESLAVSGPKIVVDGSGLGFKELVQSPSISI